MKRRLCLYTMLLFVAAIPSLAEIVHKVGPGGTAYKSIDKHEISMRVRVAAQKYASHAPVPRFALFDAALPATQEELIELKGNGVFWLRKTWI